MIEISSCYCQLKLESNDFTKIMMEMNQYGLSSLVWQSKLAMLSTAGIVELNDEILNWIGFYRTKRDHAFMYHADLFVEGDTIVYVMIERARHSDEYKRIEIGVFSENSQYAKQLLQKYSQQFNASVKAKLDGRRVRHMEFKWLVNPTNDIIDAQVTFEKRFKFATVNESESQAALRIRDMETRNLLLQIAQQDPTKTLQFDSIRHASKMGGLDRLQSWDLIKPKLLIMCRESASKISLVDSMDDLDSANFSTQTCEKCGRLWKEELLKNVYQLSELGRKITRSSHWMTVLVTDFLVAKGISLGSIIWNLSEASEEVDCMVQFQDKVWIFEFKDRNFEAGDAYALYYRGVKFKADRIIVITTGKVSSEARMVFSDLLRSVYNSFSSTPVYIEGLDSLEEEISILVKNETLFSLSEKAKNISQLASMDFSPIFLNVFGKYQAISSRGNKEKINIFRSF
jgi:hypothetical protein